MRAPSLFLLSLAPVLALAGPAGAAQHRTHGHSAHNSSHHSDASKSDPAKSEAAKPAAAASAAPKAIGKFDDWEAATHVESGETICYAFTRATSSTPSVPGRGDVVLTVTQRPGMRDVVAISAGFAYPPGAGVTVQAGSATLPFYTAQRSAFARDGHAAVAAFQKFDKAVAKSPGPHDTEVTDSFSLGGFSAAYEAVNKACPATGERTGGDKPKSGKSGKAR